jgi:hypothetical protein
LLAMQQACSLHYAVYSRAETHRCHRTRPLSVATFFLLALLSNLIPSRAYWCWRCDCLDLLHLVSVLICW